MTVKLNLSRETDLHFLQIVLDMQASRMCVETTSTAMIGTKVPLGPLVLSA